MELSPCDIHFLALVDPFVLTKLRVKGSLLEPSQLECKSRSQFLQSSIDVWHGIGLVVLLLGQGVEVSAGGVRSGVMQAEKQAWRARKVGQIGLARNARVGAKPLVGKARDHRVIEPSDISLCDVGGLKSAQAHLCGRD